MIKVLEALIGVGAAFEQNATWRRRPAIDGACKGHAWAMHGPAGSAHEHLSDSCFHQTLSYGSAHRSAFAVFGRVGWVMAAVVALPGRPGTMVEGINRREAGAWGSACTRQLSLPGARAAREAAQRAPQRTHQGGGGGAAHCCVAWKRQACRRRHLAVRAERRLGMRTGTGQQSRHMRQGKAQGSNRAGLVSAAPSPGRRQRHSAAAWMAVRSCRHNASARSLGCVPNPLEARPAHTESHPRVFALRPRPNSSCGPSHAFSSSSRLRSTRQ